MYKYVSLYKNKYLIPEILYSLSEKQIKKHSNGCGSESAKIDLVPDKLLSVSFEESCIIHDICYALGVTEEDKKLSDRLFLFNLLVDVDSYCNSNNVLNRCERVLLREAAFVYYKAVSDWGTKAFWEGKIKNE